MVDTGCQLRQCGTHHLKCMVSNLSVAECTYYGIRSLITPIGGMLCLIYY